MHMSELYVLIWSSVSQRTKSAMYYDFFIKIKKKYVGTYLYRYIAFLAGIESGGGVQKLFSVKMTLLNR